MRANGFGPRAGPQDNIRRAGHAHVRRVAIERNRSSERTMEIALAGDAGATGIQP